MIPDDPMIALIMLFEGYADSASRLLKLNPDDAWAKVRDDFLTYTHDLAGKLVEIRQLHERGSLAAREQIALLEKLVRVLSTR